jgi:hypothetical protein
MKISTDGVKSMTSRRTAQIAPIMNTTTTSGPPRRPPMTPPAMFQKLTVANPGDARARLSGSKTTAGRSEGGYFGTESGQWLTLPIGDLMSWQGTGQERPQPPNERLGDRPRTRLPQDAQVPFLFQHAVISRAVGLPSKAERHH